MCDPGAAPAAPDPGELVAEISCLQPQPESPTPDPVRRSSCPFPCPCMVDPDLMVGRDPVVILNPRACAPGGRMAGRQQRTSWRAASGMTQARCPCRPLVRQHPLTSAPAVPPAEPAAAQHRGPQRMARLERTPASQCRCRALCRGWDALTALAALHMPTATPCGWGMHLSRVTAKAQTMLPGWLVAGTTSVPFSRMIHPSRRLPCRLGTARHARVKSLWGAALWWQHHAGG